jgi:hypothetical protein
MTAELDETSRKAAKAELNLLANLIVPTPARTGAHIHTMSSTHYHFVVTDTCAYVNNDIKLGGVPDKFSIINLFPDTSLPTDDAKTATEKTAELITFDAEVYRCYSYPSIPSIYWSNE